MILLSVRQFCAQLGWEFCKLAARRRTWLAFGTALVFEVMVSGLLHIERVRTAIAKDLWKMRWRFDEAFSGLTTAAHLLGEVATIIGSLGIALVAADIVAKESEEGTLRMTLCRPVRRMQVLLQKLIVCTVYVAALTFFNGATALTVGLLSEGRGPLLMIAPHENIIGIFDYGTGLERYGIAVLLLVFAAFSGMVVGFALSCFDMRPATAAALALTWLIADTSIRVAPELAHVRPWCMTTRLLSWRQAFNQEIPWTRIQRNYAQLLWWDLTWIAVGATVFCRRDLTR